MKRLLRLENADIFKGFGLFDAKVFLGLYVGDGTATECFKKAVSRYTITTAPLMSYSDKKGHRKITVLKK